MQGCPFFRREKCIECFAQLEPSDLLFPFPLFECVCGFFFLTFSFRLFSSFRFVSRYFSLPPPACLLFVSYSFSAFLLYKISLPPAQSKTTGVVRPSLPFIASSSSRVFFIRLFLNHLCHLAV